MPRDLTNKERQLKNRRSRRRLWRPACLALMAAVGTTLAFAVGGNHVMGTVKYIGPLSEDNTRQDWLGIELTEPIGKHSGRGYFSCKERHGLFVKASTASAASPRASSSVPQCGPLFSQYVDQMKAAAAAAGKPFKTLARPCDRC